MIIFVDENIPYLPEALYPCGKVITFNGRTLKNKDLSEYKCDTLFVRSTTKVNEKLLEKTVIRFVGTATSGIDHIDKNHLDDRGIHFEYAPGSNANSVTELVVYSMLKWAKLNNTNLKGKTIGIIGYGNIGKIVALYADYFSMKVLVNDPPLKKENFQFPGFTEYVDLNAICKQSDILTNHVPLTKETEFPTYRLLGEEEIPLCSFGTLFIHASRGYVVDEEALLNRLRNKSLNAVIDVWENEPLINGELAGLSLLSTPHTGGYSRDGKLRGALMMAKAFENYSGLKPDYSVIKDELSTYKPLQKDIFRDEDCIYKLLHEKRKLQEDHDALLATLKLSEEERSTAFDMLRKEYPARRESL